MRVLMLTPAMPWPPHQGGAMRNYGLLHGLRAAGHRLTLLSFGEQPAPASPLPALCEQVIAIPPPQRGTRQRLGDLLRAERPDLALRLVSPEFERALQSLLNERRFDLVQIEGLEMATWLSQARCLQPDARCIYDAHNAEYRLQESVLRLERDRLARQAPATWAALQLRRIRRFEREICQTAHGVLAVSAEDAAALHALAGGRRPRVIPNGIFVDEYCARPVRDNSHGNILTFTGKMDYRPNVDAMRWFCAEVLPLVTRERPATLLNIVGQNPHRRLKTLGKSENIHLGGHVPDIRPWLAATDVYVAPLRMGSGTRLKLMEAMACGLAIVATPLAISGLPTGARDCLRVADSAPEQAAAILELLRVPDERARLGAAARQFARQHCDWSAIIPGLLAAHAEICA